MSAELPDLLKQQPVESRAPEALRERAAVVKAPPRPKIIQGRPPNFAAISAKFPAARNISTIFAYGDTIYCGDGQPLAHSLYEHELVHLRQQAAYGSVEDWWAMYLASSTFRFEAELEAHIVEYSTLRRGGANRNTRRKAKAQIAARLSGPLYGKLISKAKAMAYLETCEVRHGGA